MKWMVEGPDGPIEADRPSDEALALLAKMDEPNNKVNFAYTLARQGLTVDAAIDVYGGDHEKTMAQRRAYGYVWVPAVGMDNVTAAPGPDGQVEPPPIGAILVPPEEGWPE
jgi:hypothetical protein